MTSVTRSGRSSRPPVNRDQALVPLIQRREENAALANASYVPGMIAAGLVDARIASMAEPDNAGEPNAAMANASSNSTTNAPLELGR
jgi:hypothetical protein